MTNEETIKMAFKKKLPVQPIVFSNNYFINKEKHMFEPGVYIVLVLLVYYNNYIMLLTSHCNL